jgi:hypothetical protein
MFTDDLKLYMQILSTNDSNNLQSDLNKFHIWCSINCLSINLNKCAQITFSRRKSNIKYQYSINGSNLPVVIQIKDLGIILSSDLSFNYHINEMCNKATYTFLYFGFIRRNCSELNNPNSLKTLFFFSSFNIRI